MPGAPPNSHSFQPRPAEILAAVLLIVASLFFAVVAVVFYGGLLMNIIQLYVIGGSFVLCAATGGVGFGLLAGRRWARWGAAVLAMFFIGGLLFVVATV